MQPHKLPTVDSLYIDLVRKNLELTVRLVECEVELEYVRNLLKKCDDTDQDSQKAT